MHAYLAETGSEDNNFINFAHLLEEVVDAWSLDHVNVVPVILNFHGHYIVGLLNRLRKDQEMRAS